MALIDITHLGYESRLNDISFSANTGEIVGILGPNGAGKSTILKAIAGLVETQGNIKVDGLTLDRTHKRAQLVSYLPQQQEIFWSLSVRDIVALGRAPWNFDHSEIIEQAIKACGIETFTHRKIDQLSGGESARVNLARVIATQAPVLLADEPLASLDLWYQQKVMRVLRQYADGNRCVIMSIHDLSLAARYCDKLALIKNGQLLAFGAAAEVLTVENILCAYGVETLVDFTHNPPLILAK